MITKVMKDFLQSESSGGIILILFTVLAFIVVNSDLNHLYHSVLSSKASLNIPLLYIYKDLTVKEWINDGFMAIFFLLVGLELKREIVRGELSSKSKVILPIIAAMGGVMVPAIIYSNFNFYDQTQLRGWAIPTATDIAFAVGVLNIFGKKIANSLKIFLIALAIIDDLIAILIIVLFYSHNINVAYLDLAFLIIICLFIFNKLKINNLLLYLASGIVLWALILKSGVHPTISGVILAFFIPISPKTRKHDLNSPLHRLEKSLYGPVSYIILPTFAFANAGIDLSMVSGDMLLHNVVLGIALGLFLGKQIGVGCSVLLLSKLNIIPFFRNANWLEFYGVALLTGIGFTMSLFIANLSFDYAEGLINEAIMGVMLGSFLSAVTGCIVLLFAIKNKNKI